MRKISSFPLLFSLSSVVISFFFTLTSWSSDNSTICTEESICSLEPAAPLDVNTLPLNVNMEDIIPLENLYNVDLQKELEAILKSNSKWALLAKNKALSIGIVDMIDPLNARYAAINSNNMVYAASLPKIGILLASEDAIATGKIKETAEVKQDMRMMIAKSCNAAASRMFNRCGVDYIAGVLQDPCYKLYDKQNGGGLWVGKPYGGGGVRKGDPLKNLSHAASVMQVAKFYYMLAFGQLVNEERSTDMLQMLVDPQLHHKFVSVLDRVAPEAKVYRKSGTWENWHADSALVWDKTRRYIVVALAQDASGETILRELMLKMDNVLAVKS